MKQIEDHDIVILAAPVRCTFSFVSKYIGCPIEYLDNSGHCLFFFFFFFCPCMTGNHPLKGGNHPSCKTRVVLQQHILKIRPIPCH